MNIRKTTPDDIERVMEIYALARKFMREHDNPNQWLGGKPERWQIEQDIAHGTSYVCVHNERIIGVLCFSTEEDPTYKKIYDGQWLSDEKYAVVHRIASSGEVKGTGTFMMKWAYEQYPNVRVDTHEDNYVMQNMLKKLGYTYCGIIYLTDGTPRLAFQKK